MTSHLGNEATPATAHFAIQSVQSQPTPTNQPMQVPIETSQETCPTDGIGNGNKHKQRRTQKGDELVMVDETLPPKPKGKAKTKAEGGTGGQKPKPIFHVLRTGLRILT